MGFAVSWRQVLDFKVDLNSIIWSLDMDHACICCLEHLQAFFPFLYLYPFHVPMLCSPFLEYHFILYRLYLLDGVQFI